MDASTPALSFFRSCLHANNAANTPLKYHVGVAHMQIETAACMQANTPARPKLYAHNRNALYATSFGLNPTGERRTES